MFKKASVIAMSLLMTGCSSLYIKKDGFKAAYMSVGQNTELKGITLSKVNDQTWTARVDEFGRDSGPGMSALEKIGEAYIDKMVVPATGGLMNDDSVTGEVVRSDIPWFALNLENSTGTVKAKGK